MFKIHFVKQITHLTTSSPQWITGTLRDLIMMLPYHISDGNFVLLPCNDGWWYPLYMTLKPSRSTGRHCLGCWFLVESGQTWRLRGDWDQLGVLQLRENKMQTDQHGTVKSLLIITAKKYKWKKKKSQKIPYFFGSFNRI